MRLECWKFGFQCVTYAGMICVVVGTIVTDICSKRIESNEKAKAEAIARERDAAIAKSSRILADMTAFYGEIDNKINKFVLLVDFDRPYSAEEMNGFHCFLKLDILGRIYQFGIKNALRETTGEKSLFLKLTSAMNHNWDTNRSKASFWNNQTEVPFMMFDLWFFLKDKPGDLTLRGLDQSYFEIAIDHEHAEMVKSIAINANDWTIYERHSTKNNWEKSDVAWLPNSANNKTFSIYLEEHNGMKYYGGKINFKEGAFRYSTTFVPK